MHWPRANYNTFSRSCSNNSLNAFDFWESPDFELFFHESAGRVEKNITTRPPVVTDVLGSGRIDEPYARHVV